MDRPLKTGFGWTARLGIIGVVVLLGSLVAWAHFVWISGAVIATGSIAIQGKPKQVQHFDGGVIEDILVSEGDTVIQGETLIVLDKTLLEANLAIYKARLAELLVRRDRLEAEQADLPAIEFAPFPPLLAGLDAETFRIGQREVFAARRALQQGREVQLREKMVQFGHQITGVEGLIASKRTQLSLIRQEMETTRTLEEKRLVAANQLMAIRRSEADLEGQLSEHQSEIARIRNSIQDAELEILQNRRQFKEQVVSDLGEVVAQIGELQQQVVSTEKQLDRVALKAPVSGIVHEMQVFTKGGVVQPGATVLQIVPVTERLTFELQVSPVSIDQVYVDQPATIRFSAFDQRTTPELTGTVRRVSPTSLTDPQTGVSFYVVELDIPDTEIAQLGALTLVPGMPLEGYLQTNARSVLSYVVKPMTDHLARAFREN
ncbi:HlyD family type I secretion periplasmic adaptor subunit [Thalassococcus sp. CAU 1522]|uniref:Membrane fusion protein (MFP) family protein n=1 Tax=Thalassococcus arenae TaxID=2851652 RepID=A0ABS6N9U4_9RHOB|nr:HlyD family type I secretion periplasmic adaptor subunit [Thalassococcus arenae]MBV2360788.1 HlyD family type I secretion periplasmic adaptor subunit [Thalassococcus arenae]